MSYTVIIEPGENGFLVAHCPEIPGCHSQGATYEEAIANIKEAIEACLEVKEGRPIKVEISEIRATAIVA